MKSPIQQIRAAQKQASASARALFELYEPSIDIGGIACYAYACGASDPYNNAGYLMMPRDSHGRGTRQSARDAFLLKFMGYEHLMNERWVTLNGRALCDELRIEAR